MIILDHPFVSDHLIETVEQYQMPVLQTPLAEKILSPDANFISDRDAIALFKQNPLQPLYTNSENSIGWIAENLEFTGLPEKISFFKDKVKFRNLMQDLYPGFFFQGVSYESLSTLDLDTLPLPFIIKPSVGFFSLGVSKVSSHGEWPATLQKIEQEIEYIKSLYPREVLDTTQFIIEGCIPGVEYAFDAYFDDQGKPVILTILKHLFSSDQDVSDRVYLTSKQIVLENLERMENFLLEIGRRVGLKNFPLHVEVRINDSGQLLPIEVNPMRFGGWCTTADLSAHAFGFNQYDYFLSGKKPDWHTLLEHHTDIFSIIVLDNSTGIRGSDIASFNFEKLIKQFKNPLDLRPVDHQKFPLFGFVFTQTAPENFDELLAILKSDLTEFLPS